MAEEYEYQKAIRELREQGLTVEMLTPDPMMFTVRSPKGESFTLTPDHMTRLRRLKKLTLAGIKELHALLKAKARGDAPSN